MITPEMIEAVVKEMNTSDMTHYDSHSDRQQAEAKRYLSAALALLEPIRPSYQQIIDLVEDCRKRRDDAGESSLMMAKWISEGLNALYAVPLPASVPERSYEPEFPTDGFPDNEPSEVVLRYVLECAQKWVQDARIIGNARAGDIERAIRSALAAPVPQPVAVQIKPLEWNGNQAHSLGLEYHVWWYSMGSRWLTGSGMRGIGNGYSSADEAKAAAQADYETRIRSALVNPVLSEAEEIKRLMLERDANNALAIENGERAKEEYHRAESFASEIEALKAESERLKSVIHEIAYLTELKAPGAWSDVVRDLVYEKSVATLQQQGEGR